MSAIAASLISVAASANGRFPGASHLVMRGDHGIITSSFGVITTRDRFTTPSWACEVALGYDPGQNNDLGAGIFADNTFVVSGPAGLTISTDLVCSNPTPAGPIADRWFMDVTIDQGDATKGLAVSRGAKNQDCTTGDLFESVDSGKSWSKIGPLPAGFCPLTVDSAPSDPQRVYVSGNALASDGSKLVARMLVSDDRGKTWTGYDIANEARPFIGAMDPLDRDTLYVRTVNPPSSGRLFVSSDGAKTYREIANLTGVPLQFFGVTGLAVSPDGKKIAYGSVNEGLFVIDGKGGTPEKRSSMPVLCLAWTTDGLYGCSAPNLCGPFFVGVSRDDGRSFTTVLPTLDVAGDQSKCSPDTPSAQQCPKAWGAVRARLGGCTDGGAAEVDAGPADAGADAGVVPPPPKVSCDCRSAGMSDSPPHGLTAFVLSLIAAGGGRAMRRRESSRCSKSNTLGALASRRRSPSHSTR